MFLIRKHLSRRTLLKGAGFSVALPLLDAMIPAATALAQTAAARTLRAGFFYLPHGAIMDNTPFGASMDRWTPSGAGTNFQLNVIMKSLEPYKKYVTSFGNIKNDAVIGKAFGFSPASECVLRLPEIEYGDVLGRRGHRERRGHGSSSSHRLCAATRALLVEIALVVREDEILPAHVRQLAPHLALEADESL